MMIMSLRWQVKRGVHESLVVVPEEYPLALSIAGPAVGRGCILDAALC